MRANDAAGLCCDRREIDDAPPAALAHAGKNTIGDEKSGLEIDAEDLVPVALVELGEVLDLSDAGIVDEDVDEAEVAFDGGDEPLDIER